MRNLWIALLVTSITSIWSSTSHGRILGGDSIGPNNSLTNNNAGAPATYFGVDNFGMPAIEVDLQSRDQLTRLDVVVFGTPSSSGVLDFSAFSYFLNIWSSADYFGGLAPSKSVDISTALENVTLGNVAPNITRPIDDFGVVGPLFPGIPTHLISFDLSQVMELIQPVGVGPIVVAFQSEHDMHQYGLLNVSGSISSEGALPLFSISTSDGGDVPRGIFGDQAPDAITLRWGMNLSARLAGDYDDDGTVTLADYGVWKSTLGATPSAQINGVNADGNRNGIVDAADYTVWRDNLISSGAASSVSTAIAVPEPSCATLIVCAVFAIMLAAQSRQPTR